MKPFELPTGLITTNVNLDSSVGVLPGIWAEWAPNCNLVSDRTKIFFCSTASRSALSARMLLSKRHRGCFHCKKAAGAVS